MTFDEWWDNTGSTCFYENTDSCELRHFKDIAEIAWNAGRIELAREMVQSVSSDKASYKRKNIVPMPRTF